MYTISPFLEWDLFNRGSTPSFMWHFTVCKNFHVKFSVDLLKEACEAGTVSWAVQRAESFSSWLVTNQGLICWQTRTAGKSSRGSCCVVWPPTPASREAEAWVLVADAEEALTWISLIAQWLWYLCSPPGVEPWALSSESTDPNPWAARELPSEALLTVLFVPVVLWLFPCLYPFLRMLGKHSCCRPWWQFLAHS